MRQIIILQLAEIIANALIEKKLHKNVDFVTTGEMDAYKAACKTGFRENSRNRIQINWGLVDVMYCIDGRWCVFEDDAFVLAPGKTIEDLIHNFGTAIIETDDFTVERKACFIAAGRIFDETEATI